MKSDEVHGQADADRVPAPVAGPLALDPCLLDAALLGQPAGPEREDERGDARSVGTASEAMRRAAVGEDAARPLALALRLAPGSVVVASVVSCRPR